MKGWAKSDMEKAQRGGASVSVTIMGLLLVSWQIRTSNIRPRATDTQERDKIAASPRLVQQLPQQHRH